MNRPSYKELWLYECKDRDEQLQWIRNAVNGNAKFRNSEPPYSEEEELARKIMQMHSRIAELEMKIRHNALWQASEDAEERSHLEKLVPDLKKRIAELEATVEVGADIAKAYENRVSEIVALSNETVGKLNSRIAELETDNAEFRQLIRDWSIVLEQNNGFWLWQVESVRQAMLEINKEREASE